MTFSDSFIEVTSSSICRNRTCRLYQKSSYSDLVTVSETDTVNNAVYRLFEQARAQAMAERAAELGFNPFDYIKEIISKVFDRHLPLFDFDNDTYSSTYLHMLGVCIIHGCVQRLRR